MAIGKRIKLFRNRKGLSQKQFGEMLGFLGKTSDVRIAQYEKEDRTPKEELVGQMADILEVSPYAITVPDIDSPVGLMHTFFALEDMYGLQISEKEGELCVSLGKGSRKERTELLRGFLAWQRERARYDAGEITKEEYDTWRYCYIPEFDDSKYCEFCGKEIVGARIFCSCCGRKVGE